MIDTLSPEDIDRWADDLRGPVALHFKQLLLPAEGKGGVIFPATYAKDRDNDTGYQIDEVAGQKVAQIDSVGSQANRMEPIFRRAPLERTPNPLAALVPQVEIAIDNQPPVSLLEAGHRLGDAIVRASDLAADAKDAFRVYKDEGDAAKLAKLAPTSLVFGVWDSRGDQAKLPRIVYSVIRAWNVDVLRRSAQYNPSADYAKADVFSDEDKAKADGDAKSPLAQQGFVHVPAVGTHGGIVAHGDIRRDVTVNLVALRQLDGDNGQALRRYILSLALVAATEPQDGFLRQGCLLAPDPDVGAEWQVVERTGVRRTIALTAEAALSYAQAAAAAFGVGPDRAAKFDKRLAQGDLPAAKKGKADKKKGGDDDQLTLTPG